jgi:hypothetical protein
MIDRIEPKIKPHVQVTIQQDVPTTFNGKYTLVALDKDGNEKPRTEFEIGVKGFNKLYASITEKPEGTATANPQFRVKKKPTT